MASLALQNMKMICIFFMGSYEWPDVFAQKVLALYNSLLNRNPYSQVVGPCRRIGAVVGAEAVEGAG